MISASMISADMRVAEGIAKFIAPMETGNLRYNAIVAQLTNDGYRIKYDLSTAYYIYFLEEGTEKYQGAVGFIANQTVPTIASYQSAKYEQKDRGIQKHFQYYSRIGLQDTFGDSDSRKARLEQSLSVDVDKVAANKGWQHNPEIERFDSDFRNRRL